ncbi:glycosyl hydrolase family 28-related protein [Tichowtungia aerotolerans]|uniref:Rhamnogalacturonase A/B/Epimerase-like pectate lyase domain-containing protein n=1 Tax=Tichowtungia aerotolerans TaxID=2697043 RepID=A0A6P1MAZ6_9BACT|nr:glycosyl hydrolase family 28-related protein [Tichowtungia aerotolerans]QHI69714.1 hypothetical protein GT409_09700 [Tichowtungia aerotolerans]
MKFFILFLVVLSSMGRADRVINGSFETGTPGVLVPPSPSVDVVVGWRAFDTSGAFVTYELISDPKEAFDGNNYIRITSTASEGVVDSGLDITWGRAGAFTVSTGVTYTVSFAAKRIDGTDNSLFVGIKTFDGNVALESLVSEGMSLTDTWAVYSYDITPTLSTSSGDDPVLYIGFRPKSTRLLDETICLDAVRCRGRTAFAEVGQMALGEADVRLTVFGADRTAYSLQSTTNLASSPIVWSQHESVQGSGVPLELATAVTADPVRFFRVETEEVLSGTPAISAVQYAQDDLPLIAGSVTEYGADPSGLSDSTTAFTSALNACASQGGGTVFVPAGEYRIDGTLRIPSGVTLRGDWCLPEDGTRSEIGTLLKAYAGRGDPDGTPFIQLGGVGGLKNMAIWYPEQAYDQIVAYPWTIKQSGIEGMTVENVTLFNAYQGIKIGPEVNELHLLRNIYGTPLRYGLFRDRTTDVGRAQQVCFSPDYWAESGLPGAPAAEAQEALLREWMQANGEAFVIHFPNWIFMCDIVVDGYRTGISTWPSIAVDDRVGPNGGVYGLTITNCMTGIQLGNNNEHGFLVTKGNIHTEEAAVLATSEFASLAQFNAVSISGAVSNQGSGLLSFVNSEFVQWPAGQFAIHVQQGGLAVLQSAFRQNSKQIYLGAQVRGALIVGNSFPDTVSGGPVQPYIENHAFGADVDISHEALNLSVIDTDYEHIAPVRRPQSRLLYDAKSYGAQGDGANDDSLAIQAALRAARQTGGTVYLPPGKYLLADELMVPTGVELRGSFDTPHHTLFDGGSPGPKGAQLIVNTGQNEPEGAPLIRLEAGAGVRGITVYYPDQTVDSTDYIPYPWTIQGLGSNVWVRDVTLVNPYQGIDFGTYDTTGHVIDYVAGSPLVTGAFVGRSAEGWVQNVQFIPHYWTRSDYANQPVDGPTLRGFTQQTLDGMIFGACENEHVLNTFVYGARRGLRLIEQNGTACSGTFIAHGTDGSGTALQIDAAGSVDFMNTQLVAMETTATRRNIYVTGGLSGTVRFFNTICWGQPDKNIEINSGKIELQQAGFSRAAPVELRGGQTKVNGAYFQRDAENIVIRSGIVSAQIVGNVRIGNGAESENFINEAGSAAIFEHNIRMP